MLKKIISFNLILFIYLLWNLIVFLIYRKDKVSARKHRYRTEEKKLIKYAFLMGALGAFAALKYLRHKTRHIKFLTLVPIALILNILVLLKLYAIFG